MTITTITAPLGGKVEINSRETAHSLARRGCGRIAITYAQDHGAAEQVLEAIR